MEEWVASECFMCCRMAYGNETGLVIVDIVQKVSLLFLSTADLGSSSADPCQRTLRSPKRYDETRREAEDKARSPSMDQVTHISLLFLLPRAGSH